MYTEKTNIMAPNEQVKTVMDIFIELSHGDQVSLFQTIQLELLKNREERLKYHHSIISDQNAAINQLNEGNRIIANQPPLKN